MEFNECAAILEEFEARYPHVLSSRNAHGIQIAIVNDKLIIQLLVTAKMDVDSLRNEEVMPESFSYGLGGQENILETQVLESSIPRAISGVGYPAHGAGIFAFGTIGWNILLNNELICISNWHIFCGAGNDTEIGSNICISSTGSVLPHKFMPEAELFAFQKLFPASTNIVNSWDCALGRYLRGSDFIANLRSCSKDGDVYPYPQRLSENVSLRTGEEYRKVGAASPICRTGQLQAIGNRYINYNVNNATVPYNFKNQLIFSCMSTSGDSGSTVVRASDNTVTGLIFAGDDSYTIANPMFNVGWEYQGTTIQPNGMEAPMFTGKFPPCTTNL